MKNQSLFIGATALAVAFPLIAVASPIDIPNAFTDGDAILAAEFNENFDAIADAVNDNDARIAALEEGASGSGVPQGTIAFFAVDTCPEGWGEYADLRGRVPVGLAQAGMVAAIVGTALGPEETIEISDVPSHTHQVDPPPTASGTESAGHTHQVDPPSTFLTITTDGDHTHTVDNGNGGLASTHLQAANAAGDGGVADSSAPITSAGDHSHPGSTVNITPFPSQGASATHTHTTNILAFASLPNTGAVASIDVTMPYIQLLACEKQ